MKNHHTGILYSKEKYAKEFPESFSVIHKLLTRMRITLFFLFLCTGSLLATSNGQNLSAVSLTVSNGTMLEALRQIENQTDYSFVYNVDDFNVDEKVSFSMKNKPLNVVLDLLFADRTISYKVAGKHIALYKSMLMQQTKKHISGIVTDAAGEPVIGANVIEKGTGIGTITDLNGSFVLDVTGNIPLVVSYIGYTEKEVAIGRNTTFQIVLEEDSKALDEVVVVGYGTQKKVNLTGAVSSVTGDELAKRPVGQTSMALQGIAPGVTITQRSGQPGQDAGNIRIRGIGTLNDSNPLVLVDGTEMDLNSVDPNLIESVSVLKDAASASIYGSRAANGVILVTTKRAKSGEFSVSYNGYAGWQTPTDLPDKVGAIDHMVMLNEAYTNVGRAALFSEQKIQDYLSNKESDPDHYPDVDWQKAVYQDYAFQQNHFFTLNGGTDKMRLIAALGYFDQQGIIPNTDYKRYTVRLNSDMKFTNRFSAKLDMFVRYGEQKTPSRGVSDAVYWVNRTPSIYPEKLTSGKWAVGWDGDNVSAFTRDGGEAISKAPSLSMNLGLNYKFTDFLQLDVVYVPTYQVDMNSTFSKALQTYYPDGELAYTKPVNSALYEYRAYGLSHDFKALANFDKKFGNHALKVLGGFSWESGMNDYINASRDTFIFPEYQKLNAGGSENQQTSGSGSESALSSLFGRVNYDFRGRYLFEANVRYDGSSRFDVGQKWGVFPSFSAGWRLSEEPFWNTLRNQISNLKLRASWGQLGNQNIGNYAFASVVNYNSYIIGGNAVTGGAIWKMANPGISWEKTEMLDFGLDLSLRDNLSLSFDYYDKKTTGILWELNIPMIIGLDPTYQNAAKVTNKGWDLELRYNNRVNDFKYGATFMISDVKNRVVDLKGVSRTGLTVNREGYSINSIYGLEAQGYISDEDYNTDGTYKYATQYGAFTKGDIKYKDQNDDGIINQKDEVIIGNTVPRFTYSLNLNASWKGFDMSMFWQGVGKVDGYLYRNANMPFYWGASALEMHKDRWTTDNQHARFPRFAFNEPNNEQNSSFWVADASYLRLKNLQLGYSLPKSFVNRMKLANCRIFVSGQNLLSLDNFWEGFDVEAPVGDGSFYPQVRVYTVGIDLKF